MSSQKMYTVKITAGFEQNVRHVGRYATLREAVTAARVMKVHAMNSGERGGYYVAVPA